MDHVPGVGADSDAASPLGGALSPLDRELLRSAFHDAPIGMALLTPGGVVTRCNPALAALLDRPAAALVGGTLFGVTHADDVPDAQRECAGLGAGGPRIVRHECRFVRADGAIRWVLVSTSRVAGTAGRTDHLVMHIEDISERKELEDELRHRTLHDALTGLPNRVLLLDRLGHALDRGRRASRQVCVFFLDLDGFKAVNDTFGHAAGDAVLRQVAARLCATVRPADTAARLAGDEFVVVCEDLDVAEIDQVGDRLREAVRAPYTIEGRQITVATTVGTGVVGELGETAEELVHRADLAMYEGKTRRT